MMPRARIARPAVLALVLAVAACGPQDGPPESDGNWVGTVTTEGNVTTVVNESGSVWGGPATLLEEASIGVESGADEYMLGYVPGIYADGDEIFVIDNQVPIVRVYDLDGRHLRDIGGAGQGPGEFTNPCQITGSPDGSIFVLGPAANGGRINVYDEDGTPRDTWQVPPGFQCRARTVATRDGLLALFSPIREPEYRIAIRVVGPDGSIGEPIPLPEFDYERWTIVSRGEVVDTALPWTPRVTWAIGPEGALVAGASSEYAFQVRYPDGRTTQVSRTYDPVPTTDVEREYWTLLMPRRIPDDETFSWDGRLPDTKRPYELFLTADSGEIWVLREGPATVLPDCDSSALIEGRRGPMPQPCFERTWTMDVFEAGGRYLGEVRMEGGAALGGDPFGFEGAFVRGDTAVAVATDEAGTIMVKRYRLALPGRGQPQ